MSVCRGYGLGIGSEQTIPMPELDGARHRYIEARGLRFHIAEMGKGDDVVLLLHGYPQHWFMWRDVMPALAEAGHRVIAMDLRGFGWSDAPAEGYEKENMADDVLAVMDALRLGAVKLAGHDWGGWIGFLLCVKAPERFERYLALNIPHPWQRPLSFAPSAWRFHYALVIASPLGRALHRTGVIARLLLTLGVVDRRIWRPGELDTFVGQLQGARAGVGVSVYRTFILREAGQMAAGAYDNGRLKVPTFVLFGSDDGALRPSMVAGYEDHADEMQVEYVADCGHFIVNERPDVVCARAREFFAHANAGANLKGLTP